MGTAHEPSPSGSDDDDAPEEVTLDHGKQVSLLLCSLHRAPPRKVVVRMPTRAPCSPLALLSVLAGRRPAAQAREERQTAGHRGLKGAQQETTAAGRGAGGRRRRRHGGHRGGAGAGPAARERAGGNGGGGGERPPADGAARCDRGAACRAGPPRPPAPAPEVHRAPGGPRHGQGAQQRGRPKSVRCAPLLLLGFRRTLLCAGRNNQEAAGCSAALRPSLPFTFTCSPLRPHPPPAHLQRRPRPSSRSGSTAA